MLTNFDDIIEVVLHHEGGYVNDPKDPGGETNFGIAKRSHPDVDIKNLTKEGTDFVRKYRPRQLFSRVAIVLAFSMYSCIY